jgi:hypothetical protein
MSVTEGVTLQSNKHPKYTRLLNALMRGDPDIALADLFLTMRSGSFNPKKFIEVVTPHMETYGSGSNIPAMVLGDNIDSAASSLDVVLVWEEIINEWGVELHEAEPPA